MRQNLSIYKFKKLAIESFKNGLRLHFDSILLYRNQSFPSSFQLSVYVGLNKNRKVIDVHGRVSLPTEIKDRDAKKMISLLNDFLKDQCERKFFYAFYYDIAGKDELLSKQLYNKLKSWKHRSGLRTVPLFGNLPKKSGG